MMGSFGANRFKLINYNYDLISGKVNEVHYQPGSADEFYQRYEYDADNRLTDVYTTDARELLRQAGLEEHEAYYEYFQELFVPFSMGPVNLQRTLDNKYYRWKKISANKYISAFWNRELLEIIENKECTKVRRTKLNLTRRQYKGLIANKY